MITFRTEPTQLDDLKPGTICTFEEGGPKHLVLCSDGSNVRQVVNLVNMFMFDMQKVANVHQIWIGELVLRMQKV